MAAPTSSSLSWSPRMGARTRVHTRVHIPTLPLHTTAPPYGSSLASALCPCVAPPFALAFPITASPFVPPSLPLYLYPHLHLSSRPACSDYLPPLSHPIFCRFPVALDPQYALSCHAPPLFLLLPAARGATATRTLYSSCPIFASCRPRACPLSGTTPTRQCAAPPVPPSGPAATPTISRTRITVCYGVGSLLA